MALVRVYLFGYPMVQRNGVELPFDSVKVRALLAYLLLHPGEVFAREDIARLLWSEQDALRARQNLRQALYRLRRALGAAEGLGLRLEQDLIQWKPKREVLWVDVWEFLDHVAEVQDHAHRKYGVCPCCHRHYQRMLLLYREEFLHGLVLDDAEEFNAWMAERREYFRQWVLRGVHQVVRYHYLCGDYAQAEGWARRWLRWDPWSEGGYGYLIRALALQERRGEALQVYRDYETMMRQELKAEPSEDAQQLLYDVQYGLLPESAGIVAHVHLPCSLFPLFGREREIRFLLSQLAHPNTRLIALTGPGGIGKTRLAQEVAHQARTLFPDGVYWVRMAGVRTEEDLLQALQTDLSPWFDLGPTLEETIRRLSPKRMLMVLDNIEEGAHGVERWVQNLLHWTTDVVLLVTARQPLGLAAEQVVPLDGLAYPGAEEEPLWPQQAMAYPAVAMFVDRMRRFAPEFVLEETVLPAVLAIVRFTRGMPLALELAAGRAALASCQDVAECLQETLLDVRAIYRDQPQEHTSLRVLLDKIWQALTSEERLWLTSMARFEGPFDEEMAQVIAEVPASMVEDLARRSFLTWLSDTEGGTRWEMHPIMRTFLRERLMENLPAHMGWEQRARHWILHLLPRLDVNLSRDLLRLTALRSVFQGVLEDILQHRAPDELVPLVSGIAAWYRHHGWLEMGRAYFTRWLQHLASLPQTPSRRRLEGLLYRQRGLFAYLMGLSESALKDLEEALERLAGFPDLQGEYGRALQALASVYDLLGDLQKAEAIEYEALRLFYEQIARARERGEDGETYWIDIANSMNNLGVLALHQGDLQVAVERYRQAAQVYRQQEAWPFLVNTLGNLGTALFIQGRLDEARMVCEESLHVARRIQAHRSLAVSLVNLGSIILEQGDFGAAHFYFQRALRLTRQAHLPELDVEALIGLGKVLHALGQFEQARQAFSRALEESQRFQLCYQEAQGRIAYAEVLLQQGAWEEAASLLRRTWHLVSEKGFQSLEYPVLLLMAHIWHVRGRNSQAWSLLCWLEGQPLAHKDREVLGTLKVRVSAFLSPRERREAETRALQITKTTWEQCFSSEEHLWSFSIDSLDSTSSSL